MLKKVKSNYTVIGSGLAGLYAAYLASKYGTVTLLTKHSLQTSSTYWAQGGIASAIGEEDLPEFHFTDTINAGRGLCDEEAVKILVNEGPVRINELIKNGLQFDMGKNGFELGMEGGHTRRRILHLGGNETGKYIVDFLINKIKKSKEIIIFENFLVYKLIVNDEKCFGCLALRWEDKSSYQFNSDVTVIASGGAAGIYQRSTNPHSSTGDGITLAYKTGIEIVNMEFIQFHPTAFHSEKGDTFLISEAVRGEGAYLFDSNGRRFMKEFYEAAELAPRDVVARGIFNIMKKEKSEHVYLSLSHLDKTKIKSRFSNIYNTLLRYNIDVTSDLIPVSPAAHYMIGGIKTNLNGETTAKGLYAAGETAYTGVHGANRLASNSLLECLVFSYRAIEDSQKYLQNQAASDSPKIGYSVNTELNNIYLNLKDKIRRVMNENVGIVRSEKMLSRGLEEINNINISSASPGNEYYSDRLESLKTVAELIIRGALTREETRGCHIRSDFPDEERTSYNIHQSIITGIKKKYKNV